jgi:hypothetical protein
MPNRKYQAGYRFEKRVNKDVSSMLDTIEHLLYYSIESRGSKGKADIIIGFISKPEIMRCTTAARQDNGMFLFFATLDKTKKQILYNPNIEEWVRLWMTDTIT